MKIWLFFLSLILSSCCSDYIGKNNELAVLSKADAKRYELKLTGLRCVGGCCRPNCHHIFYQIIGHTILKNDDGFATLLS